MLVEWLEILEMFFFFLRHKARSSSPFHPVFKLLLSFFFPPLSNRHYFIIYFHRLTDFSFFTQKHTDPYTFVAHFVGTRFFLRLGCCEDARMKGSRSLRLLREMVYLCLNTYDSRYRVKKKIGDTFFQDQSNDSHRTNLLNVTLIIVYVYIYIFFFYLFLYTCNNK